MSLDSFLDECQIEMDKLGKFKQKESKSHAILKAEISKNRSCFRVPRLSQIPRFRHRIRYKPQFMACFVRILIEISVIFVMFFLIE